MKSVHVKREEEEAEEESEDEERRQWKWTIQLDAGRSRSPRAHRQTLSLTARDLNSYSGVLQTTHKPTRSSNKRTRDAPRQGRTGLETERQRAGYHSQCEAAANCFRGKAASRNQQVLVSSRERSDNQNYELNEQNKQQPDKRLSLGYQICKFETNSRKSSGYISLSLARSLSPSNHKPVRGRRTRKQPSSPPHSRVRKQARTRIPVARAAPKACRTCGRRGGGERRSGSC